jgi:hypothetical protein
LFRARLYAAQTSRILSCGRQASAHRISPPSPAPGRFRDTAEFDAVPWFWSDQHDNTLQIAGLPDEGDTTVARDLGGTTLYFHLKAGRLVGASAFGPIGKVAREIRLAEMLIAKRARPPAAALADPAVKLKSLLAAEPVIA